MFKNESVPSISDGTCAKFNPEFKGTAGAQFGAQLNSIKKFYTNFHFKINNELKK